MYPDQISDRRGAYHGPHRFPVGDGRENGGSAASRCGMDKNRAARSRRLRIYPRLRNSVNPVCFAYTGYKNRQEVFMTQLKKGSRGIEVMLLQSTLTKLGFSLGAVDGIFGPRTESAVKRFQRATGLTADGIVGPKTWAMLAPYIDGYIEYTVKQGDTFWNLAKHYGTTVNAIQAANPDADPLNLQIGSKLIIPVGGAVVPTDVNYSSELMYRNIASLKKRYPFLHSEVIGKSVDGKDIPCLHIGNHSGKEVFFNASHHANEWITSVLLMKYVEDLCRAYINSGMIGGVSAKRLLDKVSFYIAPMVNPDGVDLVTGALPESSTSYKGAKTIASSFPDIPFPSGWKANIRGTDLNLNYPAGWEEAKAIKYALGFTRPAPRDYVGSCPLSEPESSAVAQFTEKHDFALTLSYHTQGQIIYWKYLCYDVPCAYEIAQLLADASGYTPEITPSQSGYAGYKDWFILKYLRPAYTIEAGKGTSPLPLSQFAEIYADNVGLISTAALAAAEPPENCC